MKPQLAQEQKMQRKMTQTLLQSIQLLQYTGLELIEYIQEVAEENPLIDIISYDEDMTRHRVNYTSQAPIGELNQAEESMYTQLQKQLFTLNIPDELQPIVEFGIDSLTSEGYLDIDLETWSKVCKVSLQEVERALSLIQSLEPVGIGARTLSECLYLQLIDKINLPGLKDILDNHLEWIANNDIEALKKEYDLDGKEVKHIIELIKTCHPKPGLLLETKQSDYILPEANIDKKKGSWEISFYKWNQPTIVIDESYKSLLDLKDETSTYLKEKYRQIDWLNQAISYRTNTLELIIKQILLKQHLYFEHGPFMLKPLTLREVAKKLDLSISTVSRTISNKYVQTPQGITSLKFFFQSGLRQDDGQTVAAYTVKHLIAEAIQFESKEKPLSDEAIRNKLMSEFNIKIARRTVRKYRTQLNIPPSTKRK